MLISLAVVAVGVVASLLALSISEPQSQPSSSAEDTPPSKGDPHASLEVTRGSDSARANAPKQDTQAPSSSAGTRTLVVSGTVTDARSRAVVPDVEVEAFAKPLPGGKEARAKTQSDAKGRYSLDLVIPADLAWDPEVWAVRVFAQGDRFQPVNHRILETGFRPHATMPNTSVAVHDIEIVLQLAWTGRLVRESDGTPIKGGTATLLALAPPPTLPRQIADAETDESGRFLIRMETLEPGELAMLGSAKGYLAKMIPAAWNPARASECGTIALGEGVCLEGFVTTSNGTAPAATQVYASTRAPGDAWMFLRAGSWAVREGVLVPRDAWGPIGSDGRFRLCGLVADEYALQVGYPGCATGSQLEQFDIRAPASGIRIQLSRAVYRLHVFDARTGDRIARSRFHFEGVEGMNCNIEENYMIATDPGIESPGRIVAEGYLALKCVLPGLTASEVRDLEFRLEPLSGQVTCTIVVTSPEGTPVEEIEVEIRNDVAIGEGQGPIPRMSHLAPDGRHELPQLLPGTYHVRIDVVRREADSPAAMWLEAELDLQVREGMEPVEVRLREGGLVQATVTRRDGEPVDAWTFLVRTPGGEPEPIDWRNDSGGFIGWIPKQSPARLEKPLPAGPWTLRFEADGCVSQDVVVNVTAGATASIAVTLEPKPPR